MADPIDALAKELEGSGLSDDTPDGPEGGGKISEYAAMLQKVPLLRSLTDEERKKIAIRLKVIEFEDGDEIVTEGEAGDAMYIVQSGEAQAFVQGNVVMEYGSGAFFGELALRSNQPRAATVKASGFSTTVLQLPQEDFNWLMSQKGDIKELIEQQANSYARSGMGPYDDKDAGQLKTMVEAQALEIRLLKAENLELLKEVENLRGEYASLEAENVSLRANPGSGLVSRLMSTVDDDDDGET